MTAEEWRSVVGFPAYMVSDAGRVVSFYHRWKKPRELRGGTTHSGNGYKVVSLMNERGTAYRTVHSLVAEAFHGPRPDGMQVRHLDGDKLNNRASNLAWGSPSENALDSVAHGVHPNARKTECIHGHEFNDANTYVDRRGRRHCRLCRARTARELRIRQAFRAAGIRAA